MADPVTATTGYTLSSVFEALAAIGKTGYAIPSAKNYIDGCITRANAGRVKPDNHDLVRGIRTAHLCAIKHVLRQYRKALDDLPAYEKGGAEEGFYKNVEAFVNERLKVFKQSAIDQDVLTTDDILHAMDGLIYPEGIGGLADWARELRCVSENTALAELEMDAGRSAPTLFKRIFLGEESEGWHDAFALSVTEDLKTNERFRSIFMATKAVDTARAIAALDKRIAEILAAFPHLSQFQNDVRSTLARIETKVDAVKDDTTKILELMAEEKGISLSSAQPIFDYLGLQHLSPFEMHEQASAAIDAVLAKANAPVAPSNQGADIDAAIAASRKALKEESNAAAIAILQAKEAEEEQVRYARIAPLLREQVDMHELGFDWQGAIDKQQKLVGLTETAFGPDSIETSDALDSLATLLQTQGNYSTAKPLFERALAIAERTLGQDHPSTGTSLNNLASLLQDHGDHEGAKPLYVRALALAEKTLGPEHPTTGTCLSNLADLLYAQGDNDGAKPLLIRALAISEKTLGPEHPSTGTRLNNLAGVLKSQGDYDGAKPLFIRALAIAEKSEGSEHPSTGISLNNLASLFQAQGDYDSAKPLYIRALAIAEKSEGSEHPSTGISLNNLAFLLRAQSHYDEAKPLYIRALRIAENALGPRHPSTRIRLNNLANLLRDQGAYSDAKPLYIKALNIAEKTLGPEHPGTKTIRDNLAKLEKLILSQ
ncbi:MAG: tetratricopeptide repeat protein [Beijerinckiaceae bacterium]